MKETICDFAQKETISSWECLRDKFQCHANSDKQWIFRGHRDCSYLLQSTIERQFVEHQLPDVVQESGQRCKCPKNDEKDKESMHLKSLESLREALKEKIVQDDQQVDIGPHRAPPNILNLEDGMIRYFQRHYHHYSSGRPVKYNQMEWLALMRHHGSPARLTDWTYSFYVAVYFALFRGKNECSVWAINCTWLGESTQRILEKKSKDMWCRFRADRNITKPKTFDALLRNPNRIPLVYLVNPYRLNQRLVIQQGAFLCPANIRVPFEDNLLAMWEDYELQGNELFKYTISVDKEERIKILRNLFRLNISPATLLPGLDGFSESIEFLLAYPEVLQPHRDLSSRL